MLRILDLFTEDKPVWSVEDICAEFEYTRSTGYRYTKELADAGLLFQVGKRCYSLGSRIIQWDRQLRLSDPLVKATRALEKRPYLLEGKQAWLVCRLFKDQVICIYHFGNLETKLSYSRGLPRPLFMGATSKAILAFLPNANHMRLFLENPKEVEQSHLGSTWDEFKASLQNIRDDGFALSVSELDKEVFGLAVPIFSSDGKIQASLSCVRSVDNYDEAKVESEAEIMKGYSKQLSLGLVKS